MKTKLKLTKVFTLLTLTIVLFILFGVGGVSAVDIRVSDNNAYTWIESNTNITINTYNQTWLEFDGVDDSVNVSNPSLGENLTMSIWINPNKEVATGENFFSSNFRTRFSMSYEPNNKIGVSLGNPATLKYFGEDRTTPNNWTNIVMSYHRLNATANTAYIYINGFLNFTTNFSDVSTASTQMAIGSFNNLASAFFNGSIDSFKIFNYTLDYQEIFALSSRRGIEDVYQLNTIWANRANEGVYVWVNNNTNEVYFTNQTGIYNSTGLYPSANLIYNDTDDTKEVSGLFVSQVGTIFSSFNGSLILSVGNNTNWTSKNIFICNDSTIANTTLRYQGIDEDSLGNLYLGEYTGGDGTERCAYVHKSIDGGSTWNLVLNASEYGDNTSRHMHFVQVDKNTDYIYATTGDGAVGGYDANSSKLLRSMDGGSTWEVLRSGEYEYQYLVFMVANDGCRLFGTDVGSGNKIVRTCDDVIFTDVKVYSEYEDGYVHSSSIDNNGVIYFGTTVASAGLYPTIYYSIDNGITWDRIRTNVVSPYGGVGYSVMSNVDSNNNIYFGLSGGVDFRFNETNLINSSNLKYKFNENSGTTAHDTSGNSNDGTISGATWNNDGNIISTLINLPFLNLQGSFLQYPTSLLWNYLIGDTKPVVDYIFLNNTNSTDSYDIDIYSLTNALIFYGNHSIAGSSNINDNDGNINITLAPNNYSYVLDNFNLTEGVSREHSPLWFSFSSKFSKHIASNLTDSINLSVVLTGINCNRIGTIVYTTDSGNYTQTWHHGSYTCLSNSITFNNLLIEPANNSNNFILTYNQALQSGCQNSVAGFLTLSSLLPTLFIIFLAVIVLGFFIGNMNDGSNLNVNIKSKDIEPKKIMSAIITIIIIGILSIVAILIISSIGGC